ILRLRRRVQHVIDRTPSAKGFDLALVEGLGSDRRYRIRHLRNRGHATDRGGPRPARQVLLLREARIPHMDVEIHASGQDERVSVIDFLVPSESFLDGVNLAVLADPDAQCLQPASEEDPSCTYPHAPPSTSA